MVHSRPTATAEVHPPPPAPSTRRGGASPTPPVAWQVMGLAMARYVLRAEPIASADAEQLVAAVGPTVQRYLTGDVPLAGRPAAGSAGAAC